MTKMKGILRHDFCLKVEKAQNIECGHIIGYEMLYVQLYTIKNIFIDMI